VKTCFFVDGFNLYHAIDSARSLHKYKWLNLRSLAELFLRRDDYLSKVYYFTSLATWDQEKMRKHMLYMDALKTVGVDIILGEFRRNRSNASLAAAKFFLLTPKRKLM